MSETRRQVAERITRSFGVDRDGFTCCDPAALIIAIEAALRDRDERAAKIAEAMRPSGGRMWTDEQSACFDALSDCAVAIRRGVTNAN